MIFKKSFYLSFFVSFVCLKSLLSQGFKTTFYTDSIESNTAYQAIEIKGEYYFGGNFYDKSLGYWTGFFGKVDQFGVTNFLGSEKIDSLGDFNICNKMVSDKNGLYILGHFASVNKIFHYNLQKDSVFVFQKFSYQEHNMCAIGLAKDYDDNFVLSGFTVDPIEDQDIRIIITKNNILKYSYREKDALRHSIPSKPMISGGGKIYFVGNSYYDQDKPSETYIFCLDSTLNQVYTTKNSTDQIKFTFYKGVCLDHNKNILVTGWDASLVGDSKFEYYPKIVKFDSLGHFLWKKSFGKANKNNVSAWGHFTNIIETPEKDGYIVIGSHNYQNDNQDTLIVDAVIGKINYDGDSIWYKSYGFRDGDNYTFCILEDIISTKNGGYFAAGRSINNSSLIEPDPPGFRSILLKTDACGNYQGEIPCTTATVDEEITSSPLNVFPNPSDNYIYISHNYHKKIKIKMYSSSGTLMDQFDIMDSTHTVIKDISKFPAGYYFIVAQDGNLKVGEKKILKF